MKYAFDCMSTKTNGDRNTLLCKRHAGNKEFASIQLYIQNFFFISTISLNHFLESPNFLIYMCTFFEGGIVECVLAGELGTFKLKSAKGLIGTVFEFEG